METVKHIIINGVVAELKLVIHDDGHGWIAVVANESREFSSYSDAIVWFERKVIDAMASDEICRNR